MTSTTPPRPSLAPDADRLPWASLLVLATTTFVIVTAEMLPAAVLGRMSDGLGTSDARVAQLVSMWAAVVMLTGLPLVALTRRFRRRDVIAAGMVAVAASALLVAAAPTYPAAVGARLIGAAAVGLLWASVNAHVADLVPDRQLGPAISVVLGGATSGMVLGTPVARLIADLADWRVAFVVLGAMGAFVAIMVELFVPPGAHDRTETAEPAQPAVRHSIAPTVVLTGLVGLVLAGHYGAYTYITVLGDRPARSLSGGMGTLLLIFGVATAAGIALAGRVGQRTRAGLLVAVMGTGATLAALPLTDAHPTVGIGIVLAWGLASGALPALAQIEIMRSAGSAHRTLAGALIPVLFNGGIAVGAALASLLADAHGAGSLPLPAAGLVVLAGLALVRLGRDHVAKSLPPSTRPTLDRAHLVDDAGAARQHVVQFGAHEHHHAQQVHQRERQDDAADGALQLVAVGGQTHVEGISLRGDDPADGGDDGTG